MQFQSLVRFFTSIGIDRDQLLTYDQQKLKKISLAEFSMSEAGFVIIEGFNYDKESILTNIESADFTAKIHWEILLFKKKNFLSFMEKKNAKITYLSDDTEFFNPEFLAIYGAVISDAFAFQLRKKIQDKEWNRLAVLMRINGLILPQFEEEAFAPLRNFLQDNFENIKLVDVGNYKRKTTELELWQNFSWDLLFNNLPISLQHYCNKYAYELNKYLGILAMNDSNKAIWVSTFLIKMEHIDAKIKQTILENHKVVIKVSRYNTSESYYNSNVSKDEDSKEGTSNKTAIIVAYIIILIVLARFFLSLNSCIQKSVFLDSFNEISWSTITTNNDRKEIFQLNDTLIPNQIIQTYSKLENHWDYLPIKENYPLIKTVEKY